MPPTADEPTTVDPSAEQPKASTFSPPNVPREISPVEAVQRKAFRKSFGPKTEYILKVFFETKNERE